MKESKALYGITDHDDFTAIVWETGRGLIVTTEGKLNLQSNLAIMDVKTGNKIEDVDLRNLFMEILPRYKKSENEETSIEEMLSYTE